MSDTTRQESILAQLKDLDDATLVEMWNAYCDEQDPDSRIYDFDESFLDEYFSSPNEAVRAVLYGDVKSYMHNYICFNGYGNLDSFDYLDDDNSPYDADTLATWLDDNDLGDFADNFEFDDEDDDETDADDDTDEDEDDE